MIEIAPHEPYLDGISADAVASYAEGTGLWNLISHPDPRLRVYSGPLDDSGQPFHLVIPIHDQFRDIRVRLAAAISLIAALEDRSPYIVIDDVRKSSEDLFEHSLNNINRLGLSQIPFVENSINLTGEILRNVFTGRQKELLKIFNQFQSRERRRILVHGQVGIGKSALVLEVLSVLNRKLPEMLTAYISLPADLDLPTTALIALAREMPDDDWAQQQFYQMGIPMDRILRNGDAEIGGNLGLNGKITAKDLPITKPSYPTISLDRLLDRAKQKYPRGVAIAIDDLDKQDPSRVRQLMHDAQGMLKGKAWFMLTGRTATDLLTTERGLFDLQVKLENLDQPTTYRMLINYLNSARIDNDCTDPEDPRCVLPFLPETAQRFCEVSLGKPRLFNRLGNTVLSKAADLEADRITPEVLEQGLREAAPTLRQRAALTVQEERVRILLRRRDGLSDETITIEDLEQLGVRSFSEILPILEKLEEADLAYQIDQEDVKAFAPVPLPQ